MKKLRLLVMVLAVIAAMGAVAYAVPTESVKGTIISKNNYDFTLKKEGATIEMVFKSSELAGKQKARVEVGKKVIVEYLESPAGLYATSIKIAAAPNVPPCSGGYTLINGKCVYYR